MQVFIKRILQNSAEATVLPMFQDSDSVEHHCAPVLDIFEDEALGEDEQSAVFVVFKYLRPFEDPTFEYVGEVLTVVEHLLEVRVRQTMPSSAVNSSQGLSYLHKKGIAHG